jgi:Uma2 family endonuclease
VAQRLTFREVQGVRQRGQYLGEADLRLGGALSIGEGTRVQPDIFVIGLQSGHRPRFPFRLSDLLIVLEVVSPSSARADHHVRRVAYLEAGVPEYWIVDPDAQHVERWRPNDDRPEIVAERIEWRTAGMDHSLVIALPELFAEASSDR